MRRKSNLDDIYFDSEKLFEDVMGEFSEVEDRFKRMNEDVKDLQKEVLSNMSDGDDWEQEFIYFNEIKSDAESICAIFISQINKNYKKFQDLFDDYHANP